MLQPLSVPEDVDHGRARDAGFALHATDRSGTGRRRRPTERIILAHDVDPDDRVLLHEVEACRPATFTLQFIDELVEASYGPREALDRLDQSRAARALGTRDFTADAVELIHAVADACALHLDPEGVPLVHTGPTSSLTLALADTFTQLVVPDDIPELRDIRRKAAIRQIEALDEADSPECPPVVGHRPARRRGTRSGRQRRA